MFDLKFSLFEESKDYAIKDASNIFLLPENFRLLFDKLIKNELTYLVLNGGRASTKTQSTATFLIEESYKHTEATFICGREYMSTIKDSVYDVLQRLIKAPKKDYLVEDFKINDREIINLITGTKFIFKGFNDFSTKATKRASNQNKIKSISNIKYVWVDESQDLTEATLDILIPTGRGFIVSFYDEENLQEDATLDKDTKFIFTLNRNTEEDAVFKYFKGNNRAHLTTINILDLEPPFQNKEMLKVMEEDKKRGADYSHIWLGEPKSSVANPLFKQEWFLETDFLPEMDYIVIGVDPNVGGDDEAGIVVAGYSQEKYYIIEDLSTAIATEIWTRAVVENYHKYKANRVVYEKNQGGTFIENVFHSLDKNVFLMDVWAKKSKVLRAEPTIPLFENKQVLFYSKNNFNTLKRQLLQFSNIEGFTGTKSPDRADALVYALLHLQEKFKETELRVDIW
jgi:PBSX family phage terminase large subunit